MRASVAVVCLLFVILLATLSLRGIDGAYGFKRTRSFTQGRQEGHLDVMRQSFNSLDINEDKNLDINEFQSLSSYTARNVPADESQYTLDDLFKELDTNGDGKISWDEYIGMGTAYLRAYRRGKLRGQQVLSKNDAL